MARVFTIDGADDRGGGGDNGRCKRVRNKRTGCSVLLCRTGRGRTGWQFKKGTTVCPTRRSR